MNHFLDFINQAKIEDLSKLSGISAALAASIVEQRPYQSLDSLRRVKGLGIKMIHALEQDYLQKFPPSDEPEAAVEALPVQLPGETLVSPASNAPTSRNTAELPERLGFWSRLKMAFSNMMRAFFRIILALAILAAIAAGLYYGLPYLYEKFIQPIEINTNQINQVATMQRENYYAMETQVAALQSQVDLLETTAASQATVIAVLENSQSILEETIRENNHQWIAEIENRTMVNQALEFLSRARLYLAQSNFGIARDDVASARMILAALSEQVPTDQQIQLDNVLTRLDLALGNLPEYPVVAANDLEIAWILLMNNQPDAVPMATIAPSIPTATPVPPPTVSPTATPQP